MIDSSFNINIESDSGNSNDGIEKKPENEVEGISLETARVKLERILDPEFDQFAVRFMNRGEYTRMLQTGQLSASAEAYLFNESNGNRIKFGKYLEASVGNWRDSIENQADWAHSSVDLRSAEDFFRLLRESRVEAQGPQEVPYDKDVRERTLEIFSRKFERYLHSIMARKAGSSGRLGQMANFATDYGYSLKMLKELSTIRQLIDDGQNFDSISNTRSGFLKEAAGNGTPIEVGSGETIGDVGRRVDSYIRMYERYTRDMDEALKYKPDHKAKLDVIMQAVQDPSFLTKDKDNLRRLFESIIYLDESRDKMSGETAQYHIAVIYDLPAVSRIDRISQDLWKDEWARLGQGDLSSIMGTVVLMPDKRLVEEVTGLVAKAGTGAHPVFETNGNVVFP